MVLHCLTMKTKTVIIYSWHNLVHSKLIFQKNKGICISKQTLQQKLNIIKRSVQKLSNLHHVISLFTITELIAVTYRSQTKMRAKNLKCYSNSLSSQATGQKRKEKCLFSITQKFLQNILVTCFK